MKTKFPPVLLFLITAVLMWVAPSFAVLALPKLTALAVVVAFLGFLVMALGGLALKQAGTTHNYATPQASNQLVVKGIYRYSRNPMYLGLALILSAWALYLGQGLAWFFVVGFVVYLTHFQIKPEEAVLSQTFGQSYQAYRQTTRRWL